MISTVQGIIASQIEEFDHWFAIKKGGYRSPLQSIACIKHDHIWILSSEMMDVRTQESCPCTIIIFQSPMQSIGRIDVKRNNLRWTFGNRLGSHQKEGADHKQHSNQKPQTFFHFSLPLNRKRKTCPVKDLVHMACYKNLIGVYSSLGGKSKYL